MEIDPDPKIKLVWFFPYDLKYIFPVLEFTKCDEILGLYVDQSTVIKFVKKYKYDRNQPLHIMAIESFCIRKGRTLINRHGYL